MTEEERRKLDQEKQAQWEATAKSQYKFLQKYYHKGAFYQEEHKDLLERDYAQVTGADRSDKDVLPEFMQVRNFGKKGRGKWKHLTAEDTTAFDYGWGSKDNALNQSKVAHMGGMRGDLDHPSKKSKK
jgi:microfibrillar-associated protein 1